MQQTSDESRFRGERPAIAVCLSGGALGHEPWDAGTWSGISLALLTKLESRVELKAVFGLQLGRLNYGWRAVRAWHPQREVWRRKLYRSIAYRSQLNKTLVRHSSTLPAVDAVLQFGAYADGPSLFGDTPVLTYQDGSAAAYLDSPYLLSALADDDRANSEVLEFEANIARGAARVLTTSRWLANRFEQDYKVIPDRCINVGCGMHHTVYPSIGDERYQKAKVLFIGREFERKGGHCLLTAFSTVRKTLPDAELHVVGPEPPRRFADLAGVIWHGFLSTSVIDDEARLAELMGSCSLFVLPSRYEPFGIAPLEAMANGMPAIVTGRWALAENIRPEIDGLHVSVDDEQMLASAMLSLLSDPERLKQMGEAARISSAVHTWDLVADRIVSQIYDVVAEHR